MKKSTIADKYFLPGIPKSILDLSRLQSVPIAWTVVTGKMFKKGDKAFIELKDPLNVGEIVEMGPSKTKYKIMKTEKVTENGRLFRVARVDGFQIVQFHIDEVTINSKVRITNRRSFDQKLSIIFDI